MLILFIEDEPESIEPVRIRLEEEIPGTRTLTEYFNTADETIRERRPDIVVLDLLQGGASHNPEPIGRNNLDFIWNHRFCPVVVYSADPGQLENHESWKDHPFIKIEKKGSGSDVSVVQAIRDFRPLVLAMRDTEEKIHGQLTEAMKFTARIAAASAKDPGDLAKIVMRSGHRRVAALMDEPLPDETKLAAWEQYIFPPLSTDIQLGDILQQKDSSNDAQSFRVVLTPSCDMVRSGKRPPKVQQVLVAKCWPMTEALRAIGVEGGRNLDDRIKRGLLSQGYSQSVIAIPPLPDKIPAIAANLRDLELIPIDQIGDTGEFRVVASIDSPFRELVSWAYLQIACRPGLPERDRDTWAEEIISATQNAASDSR